MHAFHGEECKDRSTLSLIAICVCNECPDGQPCRGFTPVLKAQYEAWKKNGDKVEVVFVSSGMFVHSG